MNGLSDMAWIKPGGHDFTLRSSHHKYGAHLRPKGKIPAWRDTNNDGRITGLETINYTLVDGTRS